VTFSPQPFKTTPVLVSHDTHRRNRQPKQQENETKNIWQKYLSLSKTDQKNIKVIDALKQLDINININWPLVHYKSAVRYLQQNTEDISATGGTNWQKYLPPRFQKRIFYPQLWSNQEIEDWGKGWVENNVYKHK
jgi:tryptophan 2,3-dioxygenase